jgi:hypothetical protein
MSVATSNISVDCEMALTSAGFVYAACCLCHTQALEVCAEKKKRILLISQEVARAPAKAARPGEHELFPLGIFTACSSHSSRSPVAQHLMHSI